MTPMPVLPPEREGRLAPPDLVERRAQFAAAVAAGAWSTANTPLEALLAGRRTLVFRPPGNARARVLHFHGGGFRLGGPQFEGRFAEALARACNVEVVAPDYRLAPEYPFPAALRDAFSCLQALSESAQDDVPLIVSGDSAGAGLAASLGVLVSANGSPRVDGLVLLSPWLDLSVSAPSYAHNSATDPLFSKESAEGAAELYMQGLDRMHPLASPLHAAFSAYPPTFISVGRGEVLLDDSVRFHAKLQAQGFSSTLHVVDGMQHVAVVRGMDLPGSAETLARLTGFLEQIISKPR